MPYQQATPQVEATLARLGASLAFAEAASVLRYATGAIVSEPTVRRRTYAAGEAALAVEVAERLRIEQTLPEAPVAPEKLQVSIDATKVSVLHGDWTDMKLAAFGELVPIQDPHGQPDVQAVQLSYVVRWEPAATFATTLTTEAHRRGVDRAGVVASPNDGADWIQGVLDLIAPAAIRILDEPHAAEHLGTIGGLVFGVGSAAAATWTSQQRDRLKTPDGVVPVLAELGTCLAQGPQPGTLAGPDGEPPAVVLAREVAYFEKRAAQLAYAQFRQQGLPIGSGIAESGHKVTTEARMKRAGQHWAPAHLNPMGALRGLVASDRWEQTWPAIMAHERATATAARRTRNEQRRATRLARGRPTDDPSPAPAPPAAPSVGGRTLDAALASPPSLAVPVDPVSSEPDLVVKLMRQPTAAARRPAPDHPWRRRFFQPPRDRRAG